MMFIINGSKLNFLVKEYYQIHVVKILNVPLLFFLTLDMGMFGYEMVCFSENTCVLIAYVQRWRSAGLITFHLV